MRRLPVFFVLDCSESMVGDSLKQMEEGMQAIVRTLRTDPHALETVYLAVIAFAGLAKTIVPLIEVFSFYPPKLPLGSGTSLGAALMVLMNEIDRAVVKTTPEQKGDWKPLVYLFTDGHPTDDPGPMIARWNAHYSRRATLIAVGLGRDVDFSILRQLTEHVIQFKPNQTGDFTHFINWISASVVAQSKSVGEGVEKDSLPALDLSFMQLIKTPPPNLADSSCVTLVGRCQNTRKPYLIKYESELHNLANLDFKIAVPMYRLTGCYPLSEDYFEWSDGCAIELKVNTANLLGAPGCPYCGNSIAFAVCGCGKLLCINEPGEAICPWCNETVNFQPHSGNEQHGFDVGRSRG